MAKVPNLRLRGKVYYYHRFIPSDVRSCFSGKSQLWISLKTTDFPTAKQACLRLTLEHDEVISTFRKGEAATAAFFTDEYLDSLAQAWATEWLREDEQRRLMGNLENAPFVLLAGVSHTPASLRELLVLESKGWSGIIPLVVEEWLRLKAIAIPRESEAFNRLCYRVRAAAMQALELIRQRTEGTPITSPAPAKVGKPKNRTQLSDLIEPWKLRQKPKDSSVREFERAVARFEEKHPGLYVEDIERIHVVEYRDWLTAEGLASGTVEKHLNGVKALLSIAVERGVIKHNPASRILPPKAGKDDEEDREPFSREHLRRFFASPVYTGQEVSEGAKGPAAFWLPLMALFSGARVEELCQLRLDDFQEEEGIHFYFIRRKHKDQDTKTKGSIRRVPIHPELVRIGLLEYVAELRRQGEEWLFPLLVPDAKGNRSGNWSKWFGRYLRTTVGISDPAIVFHSFRHTFKDLCRECGVAEDVHDAITGHKSSVSRKYGGKFYPLKPLAHGMSLIQISGLDLSGISFDRSLRLAA